MRAEHETHVDTTIDQPAAHAEHAAVPHADAVAQHISAATTAQSQILDHMLDQAQHQPDALQAADVHNSIASMLAQTFGHFDTAQHAGAADQPTVDLGHMLDTAHHAAPADPNVAAAA